METYEMIIDKIFNCYLSDIDIQNILEMHNDVLTICLIKSQILNHNHCRYILNHYEKEEILLNNQVAKFMNYVYIKSETDFLEHTRNHIKEVTRISQNVLEIIFDNNNFKEYYNIPSGITIEDILKNVIDIVSLHDKSKVSDDIRFLEKYGLEKPIYKKLYKFYGLGMNGELKSLINQLNVIDTSIIEEAISNYPNWMQKLILDIEKISDYIERGQNPITVEEMNTVKKISASEYHKNKMEEIPYQILRLTEEIENYD